MEAHYFTVIKLAPDQWKLFNDDIIYDFKSWVEIIETIIELNVLPVIMIYEKNKSKFEFNKLSAEEILHITKIT